MNTGIFNYRCRDADKNLQTACAVLRESRLFLCKFALLNDTETQRLLYN